MSVRYTIVKGKRTKDDEPMGLYALIREDGTLGPVFGRPPKGLYPGVVGRLVRKMAADDLAKRKQKGEWAS